MFLVIDNYDSFVYNIVQYLGVIGVECTVCRNDQITLHEVADMSPQAIVISPGPGRPEGAGISVDLIKAFAETTPILGVCLGHQCIGYAFGAKITHAPQPVHGKVSRIRHDGKGLFAGLPPEINVARYHSLVVSDEDFPSCLVQTAYADTGELMGIRHKFYPVEGVQFHPESIVTDYGLRMMRNFVDRVGCGLQQADT